MTQLVRNWRETDSGVVIKVIGALPKFQVTRICARFVHPSRESLTIAG